MSFQFACKDGGLCRAFMCFCAACLLSTMSSVHRCANAEIVQDNTGDFFTINDSNLASDGLVWLHSEFSRGLTESEAIYAARNDPRFPDARIATISEWDDMFSAIGLNPRLDAEAAFLGTGNDEVVTSGDRVLRLLDLFGSNLQTNTAALILQIFTNPDGSSEPISTRDAIKVFGRGGPTDRTLRYDQTQEIGSDPNFSHALVAGLPPSTAVPEPSAALYAAVVGTVILCGYRRKR